MMTGAIQHFRSAILDAWRFHVFTRLSEKQGFLECEFSDFHGSLQLLASSHLRKRDKMLLRAILCGEEVRRGWNGFLLGKAKKEDVPCRFCGKRDGDGHCILTFGQMVAGKISLLLVGLRLLVLVSIYLLLNLLLKVRFGERQRSMVMLAWSVAVLFCLFLVSCRQLSGLNSAVLFLLCRRTGLVI